MDHAIDPSERSQLYLHFMNLLIVKNNKCGFWVLSAIAAGMA